MPSAVNLTSFSGLVPRTTARLLNDNQAQVASSANLTSGELRPRYAALPVFETTTKQD